MGEGISHVWGILKFYFDSIFIKAGNSAMKKKGLGLKKQQESAVAGVALAL